MTIRVALRRQWLALAACSLPLVYCSPVESSDMQAAAPDAGPVQVAFTSDPGKYPADLLTIDSTAVDGHELHVFVKHGGGCKKHEYAAVAWNGWLESHPVQVSVLIAHDAHGDPCRALVGAHLRFDLTPLRTAYAAAYQSSNGEMVLRLTPASNLNQGPIMVPYRF